MFHPVHPVYFALGRSHSQLHARNLRFVGSFGPTRIAECVFKDDGPNPRGIPDIPCRLAFSDYENWDIFAVEVWRFLEDEKKRLGYN